MRRRRLRAAAGGSREELLTKVRPTRGRAAPAPLIAALAGNRAISRRVESGLPPELRLRLEGMSGVSLRGVRVHPESSEPEAHEAHSFTRGDDIHLGPGRGEDLAHEAWHVVQQRQGRVPVTGESRGEPLNHDSRLEAEADEKASEAGRRPIPSRSRPMSMAAAAPAKAAVQLKCKICGAKSHNANNCPKNPNKKEEEGGGGRSVTPAGKKEKELFRLILPKLDRDSMYGPGAKSLVGGYNGKPNGLKDSSVRIDRQGLGNVQFQVGDVTYACATFEQDAKPGSIVAALFRSLDSGQNEAAA